MRLRRSGSMVGHSPIEAKGSLQGSVSRLDADMVVHGTPGSLLAAQVSFRRLYGNVAQRKLNLVQPTASRMGGLAFYRDALAKYVEDTKASLSLTIDRSFSRLPQD